MLWFRAVGYLLILPVPLVALVPWGIRQVVEGPFVWSGSLGQWIGAWLILNGAGLAGWCVALLISRGQGTPFPLDPPRRMVAGGPYQVMRNPMTVGVLLIVGGEAALYQSVAVGGYTLLLTAFGWAYARYLEEPEMERRFGGPYLAYKRRVPGWIPRFFPSCCGEP